MISVIIPVYNTPRELQITLQSLAAQEEKDFEVIIVDDGSEPPIELANSATGPKRQLYRIAHGGAPRARNFGWKKARGEYLLFCDADLYLRPDCLKKMKAILEAKPEIDFVYADFQYGWKKFRFWNFDPKKLREMNYINTCSLVRREKTGEWDERLEKFQDWDFWLSAVEKGARGEHIPEILFRAMIKRGQYSKWLPKFVYRLSWLKLPSKTKYEYWKKIVQEKHRSARV